MKKRSPEQWQRLITEYEASGLTMTIFCDNHEICRKHFGETPQTNSEPSNPQNKLIFCTRSVSSTTGQSDAGVTSRQRYCHENTINSFANLVGRTCTTVTGLSHEDV